MKRLTCLIVDDEPVARKVIREFAGQVPFLDVRGQCENIAKLETALQEDPIDLVFLDIEMPRRSGLDYLRSAAGKPLVILTTAFPNYALDGYELDVVDYLLKPIALGRFLKAVHKAKDYHELSFGPTHDFSAGYLFVRSDKRIEKIELKDILYFEALGNYVMICTTGKRIIAYLTMKGLEVQLPQVQFLKIHQSFLVAIARIDALEGNMIRIGERQLPISRNYRMEVIKRIEERMLKR
ncbi:LytR/AlgR family response regulator transcription factor [Hufsiella ginkgonis]|uniref:Response regulator n=1 Tax=Hufsiella ginkgonis TaxID=2695274 RepID=A0A7K1Y2L7_9SPHI|nr:LytTR family DNA-binding domain-containing protein [Hufsiella ginkgonis]MXV17237.1 response regulator [Hufsiella ginkgonis]